MDLLRRLVGLGGESRHLQRQFLQLTHTLRVSAQPHFDWGALLFLAHDLDPWDPLQLLTPALYAEMSQHNRIRDMLRSLLGVLVVADETCRDSLSRSAQRTVLQGLLMVEALLYRHAELLWQAQGGKEDEHQPDFYRLSPEVVKQMVRVFLLTGDCKVYCGEVVCTSTRMFASFMTGSSFGEACVEHIMEADTEREAEVSRLLAESPQERGSSVSTPSTSLSSSIICEKIYQRLLMYEPEKEFHGALPHLYRILNRLAVFNRGVNPLRRLVAARTSPGKVSNLMELLMSHIAATDGNRRDLVAPALRFLGHVLTWNPLFTRLMCTSPKFLKIWQHIVFKVDLPVEGLEEFSQTNHRLRSGYGYAEDGFDYRSHEQIQEALQKREILCLVVKILLTVCHEEEFRQRIQEIWIPKMGVDLLDFGIVGLAVSQREQVKKGNYHSLHTFLSLLVEMSLLMNQEEEDLMTVTRAPGTSLFEGGAIGEVSDGEDESSELSSSGGNTKFPWLFDGELVEVARACLYIFRILLQDGSEGLAADLREINNFFEEFVDRVFWCLIATVAQAKRSFHRGLSSSASSSTSSARPGALARSASFGDSAAESLDRIWNHDCFMDLCLSCLDIITGLMQLSSLRPGLKAYLHSCVMASEKHLRLLEGFLWLEPEGVEEDLSEEDGVASSSTSALVGSGRNSRILDALQQAVSQLLRQIENTHQAEDEARLDRIHNKRTFGPRGTEPRSEDPSIN